MPSEKGKTIGNLLTNAVECDILMAVYKDRPGAKSKSRSAPAVVKLRRNM